jgi:hypothetical protein
MSHRPVRPEVQALAGGAQSSPCFHVTIQGCLKRQHCEQVRQGHLELRERAQSR